MGHRDDRHLQCPWARDYSSLPGDKPAQRGIGKHQAPTKGQLHPDEASDPVPLKLTGEEDGGPLFLSEDHDAPLQEAHHCVADLDDSE